MHYAGFTGSSAQILALLSLLFFSTLSGILYGVIALVLPHLKDAWPKAWGFITASFITLMEFGFPHIFPWHIGCGQTSFLPVFQLASIFGIYGITFLVVMVNTTLFDCMESARSKTSFPKWAVIISIAALATTLYWGSNRVQMIEDKIESSDKIRIAMIQSRLRSSKHFSAIMQLSRKALGAGAELLIWPENAMGINTFNESNILKIHQMIKQFHVPMILGAAYHTTDKKSVYSSSFLVNEKGKFEGKYNKIKTVPISEGIPFDLRWPWFEKKYPQFFTVKKGNNRAYWNLFGKIFSPIICYEAIFSSFVRKNIEGGANVLVNLTNDVWFNKSDAAYQHLMLTTVRAVEFGVPFLRSTLTGITTWTDPSGKMHHPSPLFKQHIWHHPVSLEEFPTVYKKHGNFLIYICFFICMFSGLIFYTKRKKLR